MSAPQAANRATQLRRTSRKVDRVNRALAAIRTDNPFTCSTVAAVRSGS